MIIRNNSNQFARVTSRGIAWTTDVERATRFARNEAERLARSVGGEVMS